MDRPFLLVAAKLRRIVGSHRHDVCRGPLAGLASIGGAVVPEGLDVVADVESESTPGGILVTGTVATRWYAQCRRCAEDISGDIRVPVREWFAQVGATGETSATDEDADVYAFVGDDLDLEPMVRDAVLLELPLAPLCDDGCRGLCPICGGNRNEENCSCATPADSRWDVLTALKELDTGSGAAQTRHEDRPLDQHEDVE